MAFTVVNRNAMRWKPHVGTACGFYRTFLAVPFVVSSHASKVCCHQQQQSQYCQKNQPFPTTMTCLEAQNQNRLFCSEVDAANEGSEGITASPNDPKAYNPVDAETSIRYMESDAYHQTYGEEPVWFHYRPNHPGGKPRVITRKTCVRAGVYSAGNPCPICRDNHLVIDYRNVKLLKQFLSENELTIFEPYRTQICMTQNKRLLIALEKAKQMGLIEYKDLQFRTYDYTQYYKSLQGQVLLNPPDKTNEESFTYQVLCRESKV